MEFIVFSDPHFYKNIKKSYMRPDGLTSWLYEQIRVVESIFKYAIKNDVEMVICNGDLFEEKNRLPQDLYNIVWELFNKYSDQLTIILNSGNHDLFRDEDSSLKPFSNIINVISKPTVITVGDVTLHLLPYGKAVDYSASNKGTEYSKVNIAFTHEIIDGLAPEKIGGVSISPKDLDQYDIVFNGHIHKAEKYKNIYNVGSTQQHTWNEAEQTKGFIHYKDGINFVELESHKFIHCEHLTETLENNIESDNENFYRIEIGAEELSNHIFDKFNVEPYITKRKKKIIRMTEELSLQEEIENYVQSQKTSLDKDQLINVGLKLAEERNT